MIEYIYFVKCPNCEDEHFDFFDAAKEFALGCLSKKPIITQTEVNRNDFGECTDSCDLGTVWSWEDLMKETDTEPTISIFTQGHFDEYKPDNDPEFDALDNSLDAIPDNSSKVVDTDHEELNESSINKFVIVGEKEDYSKLFYNAESEEWVTKSSDATLFDDRNSAIELLYDLDKKDFYTTRVMIKLVPADECDSGNSDNFRKPIPEGMTIEQLVEEMEENEDEVECTWCNNLFDKSECRKEVDLGWLCDRCEAAIKSRGETLTFRENNYWDFLDEDAAVLDRSNVSNVGKHVRLVHNNSKYRSDGEPYQLVDLKSLLRTSYRVELNTTSINLIVKFDNKCKVLQETDKAYLVSIPCYYRNQQDRSKIEERPKYIRSWVPKTQTELISESISEDLVEVVTLHDLDNEYASGHPAETISRLEELEEAADYRKHLASCPECGAESAFDPETGICLDCGFNIQ